jgi:hypothetical protein
MFAKSSAQREIHRVRADQFSFRENSMKQRAVGFRIPLGISLFGIFFAAAAALGQEAVPPGVPQYEVKKRTVSAKRGDVL